MSPLPTRSGWSSASVVVRYSSAATLPLARKIVHPLGGRALLQPDQDPVARRVDRRLVPLPRRHREALLDEQLAEQVGGVEEGHQEVLEQVAALDPAPVLRAHRVVVQRRHVAADGRDVRRLDAAALDHLDEQQLDEVERQHALEEARLDALRAAATGACEQPGDDALHGGVGGDVRGDGHGGEHRPAAPELALERHHPAAARGDRGVPARHLGERARAGPSR